MLVTLVSEIFKILAGTSYVELTLTVRMVVASVIEVLKETLNCDVLQKVSVVILSSKPLLLLRPM